jgi:hypothetical protein
MALNFGLFPPQNAEISDSGAMSTGIDDNQVKKALLSGTSNSGNLDNVRDMDSTTYLGIDGRTRAQMVAAGVYMRFDLQRRMNDVTLYVYWSCGGTNVNWVISYDLQISLDGTTWTTLQNTGWSGVTESFFNYSGKHDLRYVQVIPNSSVGGGADTPDKYVRVYSLSVIP